MPAATMALQHFILLSVLAFTAYSAPNFKDKCFPLYKAIDGFLTFDWKERQSQFSEAFSAMTGVDVKNEDQVWDFACKLAGISTVRELADMLPIPYEEVLAMYQEHVSSIRKTGGVEASVNHLQMRVRIIELGMQQNLTNVDFTIVPVAASRDSLIVFFQTLSSEFGSNFLDWVYHNGEFRDMEKIFVLSDVDKFVDALLKSRNLDAAAASLGYDKFQMWSMLSSLKQFINEKYGTYSSYIELMQALQEYGIFDLRP